METEKARQVEKEAMGGQVGPLAPLGATAILSQMQSVITPAMNTLQNGLDESSKLQTYGPSGSTIILTNFGGNTSNDNSNKTAEEEIDRKD